jgi:polyhydroxyalkanoate synthesis repressor PhaR
MRTIRRYTNRKLYDKTAKHYITLLELGMMIRAGEDVRVVDHETGDDLTAQTLAQVIYVEQLKSPRLSVEVLTRLIRDDASVSAREASSELNDVAVNEDQHSLA